jgi:hypothetical protein
VENEEVAGIATVNGGKQGDEQFRNSLGRLASDHGMRKE